MRGQGRVGRVGQARSFVSAEVEALAAARADAAMAKLLAEEA